MNEDLSKLVATGKLPAAAAEKLSRLEPGTFCLHGSWGPGRIAGWDLGADRLTIDFESKTGHEMKLEFAAKSIEPLAPGHILARRFADRDALVKMAAEDPSALVRLCVQSFNNSMMLDRFEEILKPRVIPDARFKPWWESTKKVLRQDKAFVVPSKRNLPLELRDASLSHGESLVSEFKLAKDLKNKVKAAEAVIQDFKAFSNPETELKDVVLNLDDAAVKNIRLNPAAAFELLLVRDELLERAPALKTAKDEWLTLSALLSQERRALSDVLKNLPVARQKQLISAIPSSYGEGWLPEALARLNDSAGRTVSEIARMIIENKQGPELTIYLQIGLQNRTLSSDVLQWICRERSGAGVEVFDSDLAPALLNALEREHYDESSRKAGRLMDLCVTDKDLIGDLAKKLDPSQLKAFARRLWSSPVYDDLTRRSLLARVIRVFPEVQQLIEHPEDDSDGSDSMLIVSHQSLEDRKKAFDHLITVEIPQNVKDIEIALGYGDLRENFEFKSAKEQQRVFARRRDVMERELEKARPSDFSDAPTHHVAIGTIVHLLDNASGGTQTFTILGAWDSVPDQGVISYLSVVAKALLTKVIGDVIDLPTEEGGKRSFTVQSIEKYAK